MKLSALLLLATLPGAGVEVALEPPAGTVGDRWTVTLTVEASGRDLPTFPQWGERWGEAEILSTSPVERVGRSADGTGAHFRQRLELTSFRPGSIPLPPITITDASGDLTTPEELALTVTPLLAEEATEPQPPAALQPLPWGRRFWWAAGLLTAVAIVLLRMAARGAGAVAAPVTAADPRAELLGLLKRLDVAGPPGPFHLALSHGLRRFLGTMLGFPALERTQREIRDQLEGLPLAAPLRETTLELLQRCDAVKFGQAPSERREMARLRQRATRLARELPDPPGLASGPAGRETGAPSP